MILQKHITRIFFCILTYNDAVIMKALDIPVSVSIYSAAAILKALNIPVSVSIYSAAAILKAREK